MQRRTFGVDNPGTVADFRNGGGASNSAPRVGPVVINEIQYHPAPGGDEYVELKNITASAVKLYDPAYPTNHWRLRGAVDFDFPPNVSLGPTGSLIVVGFDPQFDTASLNAFKAAYGITSSSGIYGPWDGRLGNISESVKLEKPDTVQLPPHPDAGFVPFVPVETIVYSNNFPWPVDTSTRPSARLRANPTRPSSRACERLHQRKPTPWTCPLTKIVARSMRRAYESPLPWT